MSFTRIVSRAPTRIDLAGGTIDIWPIFLFLNRALTINAGINLFAEATLEKTTDRKVHLRSEDQNIGMSFDWSEIDSISPHPALELHLRLLRYAAQKWNPPGLREHGLSLSTLAKSPAGAGLGGSSTLSVAIIGALAKGLRKEQEVDPLTEGESFIEIVRDVETKVIRVPAGLQDYYGAMFGGLQALRWRPGRHERNWLPEKLLAGLQKRLLLFYSGQSRNSGINNWVLFKGFIDQNADVRSKFERINEATLRLESALLSEDWEAIGRAIADEWSVRKTLASGISTPDIDRAFAEASKIAPVAGKICGAGGGGCFFVYLPDPELKEKVREAVVATGARHLPFEFSSKGLQFGA